MAFLEHGGADADICLTMCPALCERFRLRARDSALTVLMKHLGGLPNERPAEVTNNTLNVTITDEQRVAAVMSLFARVRETTIDCDPAQEPAEQSLALVRKPH